MPNHLILYNITESLVP